MSKPLYGFQISQALDGVCTLMSADQVRPVKGPILIVYNTANSEDDAGEHWVAASVDNNQRGEFFDSMGMHPAVYGLSATFSNAKSWTYSDVQIQHPFSLVCGYYVIGYCKVKLAGLSMQDFISVFTSDYIKNDNDIVKWLI